VSGLSRYKLNLAYCFSLGLLMRKAAVWELSFKE